MASLWARVLAVGLSAALTALAAPARAADFVSVENVTAAAEVKVSTCSWDELPSQLGDICTDTYLLYFQARRNGTTGPPEPWSIFIYESTWAYVGGEEEMEFVDDRFGFTPAPDGYVDAQHLRTAAVRGTVPMSEGDPIAVDLRWDLSAAEVQVSGNHGPVEGFSWGRRGLDGCMVQNWLAHQRWRRDFQGVTGTLGGVDVARLYLPTQGPGAVFIEGRSTFKIILNQTGVDCVA